MLLKLAYKNIRGNGWRSLINMIILAIVLTGMIWMQSMYRSWINLAEKQIIDWEVVKGHYQHKNYEPYDLYSWEKSLAPIPETMKEAIAANKAVPILLSPATIYPQGRSTPVLVKGIEPTQSTMKIPAIELKSANGNSHPGTAGTFLPAMIGTSMARSSRLKEGDVLSLRLRNIHGAFDAADIIITHIMKSPVPSLDVGTVWMDIAHLQELKDAPGFASLIVIGEEELGRKQFSEFKYMSPKDLLADFARIKETESSQQVIMFVILIFLAMIAIFDTQVLAVFKRRKEIGTLIALGMTKKEIISLFTLEGVLYSLFAIVLTAILGFPLFYYYAVVGFAMPEGFEGFEMAGLSEPIKFYYDPMVVIGCILLLVGFTALFSWIPVSRIARLKATDALRGKLK